MVVLVILGIIAAIAVPLFINYWKKAEFRKNEENAKTVYLAAESRLTYYRSSGQWEQFKKEIQDAVKDTDSEIAQKAVFKDNKDSRLNGRIYTIKLNKSAADQTKENNLVLRLLDAYTYDKGFLNASWGEEWAYWDDKTSSYDSVYMDWLVSKLQKALAEENAARAARGEEPLKRSDGTELTIG